MSLKRLVPPASNTRPFGNRVAVVGVLGLASRASQRRPLSESSDASHQSQALPNAIAPDLDEFRFSIFKADPLALRVSQNVTV